MTKAPQGFDFSFLNEEEARKILQVLERNEKLQRAEKDRISKLQKTKRDIRWLQGVTGEWFEEIQRKKFCNETDVSQMFKQPLMYRLRKEMAKKDPMELQTSRSNNVTNRKTPTSVPSQLSFRSSFTSLFSFRKPGRDSLKLQSLGQKGCDGQEEPPVSVRGTTVERKIYNSSLKHQPVDSAFVPKPAIMREGSGMPPPWEVSMLENEFFQVLDDLDSTLAREQFASSVNTSMPHNYESRTQFSHSYSTGNRHGNITGRHKNRYNETSKMSIYDILRPGTPREGFKTFSPRTMTIYDMYRTREPRVLKEDYAQKNTFGSTSLCFDSRQRSASAATRHFTARSLHFPAATQSKSRFIPPSYQHSPKRTPLSSIIWNRSDSSRDRQNQEEFLRAPLPMEIDSADQCVNPRYFQGNSRYELYNSQNVYQSVHINAPMDNAVNSDTFENSENMPFYHQDNPFASSFFSRTFRQSREQQFGQSSFWGHQEEHFSWSDFHQSRKPFIYSDRDFEMISIEANRAPAAHGHRVPFQHSEPFSPGYRTNVFREQEEPHPLQSDFHTPPLGSMEISHIANQLTPHIDTQNICSMIGSSYHIKSSGLEYQQDSSPIEIHINKEPYSSRLAQTLESSSRASFPQIPDDKGNSQSPTSLNSPITLQKAIPNKPDSLPVGSHTEVTMTYSNSTDPPPVAETQLNTLVTEMNNEKDSTESILEDKQLNKMDQTDLTGEIPEPVSQTDRQTDPLPDFQNPFSQDPTKNDKFNFNASTTVSSKGSLKGFSRKDTSKMCISYRDIPNELKKNKSFPGNRKLNSAASLLFTQKSRISPSFPSPDRSCHQELTVSNEDLSDIVKNNSWHSEPLDNQNTEFPEEAANLGPEGEQSSTTHSTNCNKLVARHTIPCDSLDLSRIPPDSSLSNDAFFDAFVIPSTTVFSGRSPSDKDPSLGEREEKYNASKNQNNQFATSSLESQKSNDSHIPINDDVHDVITCHSYSPFKSGRGKGRIRRHISYIEKLTRMDSTSVPTTEGSSLIEENQSKSKPSELNTIYCTLPRKSPSCLISGRQPGIKIKASSIRNGPPPFQIKNNMDDLVEKYISNEFSPTSPESMSKCSKVVSDSASVASKATSTMTSVKVVRPTSVRKGPLPFLIQRAKSCPLGEPWASSGREDRKKSLVSDTDASVVTLKPWERIINPLESNSSIRDGQKEFSQECTEQDGEIAASGTSVATLSDEDPLPFCAEVSEKESRKTLHKFKTTSMFSVSGDEDNVKCLEVVSIYYTLPRKPSKKFCDLLQQYTQNTNSLRESLQADTETFPNALEEDKVNYSTQEQSGTSSSEDLKILVSSTQSCLSHTTENMAVLQSPNRGSSGPSLQEMTCVSLHKGESKTRELSSHNLAKTPPGIPQSQKEWGETWKSEALHASLMLQDKSATEEKSKDCQQSVNAGNSCLLGLPAHSKDNNENSQTGRSSGEYVGSGTGIISTESRNWPQKDHTAITIHDNSSGSQPMEVRTGTECQKMIDKILSDSESQAIVPPPALHKLQFVDKTQSGEPALESLQSEPGKLPQGRQKVNVTESRRVKDEMQKLAWDRTLHAGGNNKHNTNLDDLEKGENRSSVKHGFSATSKASRKFPAKDLSPRRHIASIFSKSGSKSDFGRLSVGRQEGSSLAPEPTPKSTEATDEDSLSNDRMNMKATEISNRETSRHSCNQKPNSISKLHQNELNVSESPPKHENFKSATVAEERESGTPAQLTFTSLREADISDHQRRLSPPFPLELPQKSPLSVSLSSCQQQQGRDLFLEWEHEPHLYRSKSLKSINVHSDLPHKSHPPKVRERHFSESTSIDNALSQLTLGGELSNNNGYSRRFKSFSELPSCDESENWALYSSKAKTGPKSASSISRPIDYGIFGKEQQLAFLENVKRSLTQGRLWKPSFLKNPGFLKDDVIRSSNPSESLSLNSPSSQVPEDSLSPNEQLNIYKEDPVDSDYDTDTTTDDEYYLNENDKESEL
ncbi:Exophilin-5 [Heterocephalus glaber]|uniref:Exophilin-5 n=1 Tax=Heterocephalus glaber TaxID=10181 RepID=G5BXR4_HETGA|nr:Exophilin-5 [Heterocephalus glaber]